MAKVELLNITKRFGDNLVIDDCSVTVNDREFLVLVGPSGCGKSTLLRIVAGLEEATSGQIKISGRDVSNLPPKDRDIAMVFQSYALYPHMSVYKNMAFGLKMRGFQKSYIDLHVREAAKILEIENLLDRRPAQLSGGQRQRVAMGRAIVRKPEVFLFDEPLSNLDAKLRVQMRLEIKKLHEKLQTTIIYVTHDQVEAMTLADRIAILEGGVTQQVDAPKNVYNKPANRFVAEFIGSPPMNFLPANIQGLTAKTDSFSVPIESDAAAKLKAGNNQSVILGIRPENFYIEQPPFTDVTVPARTEVIETLGANTVLFCSSGNNILAVTVQADVPIGLHQKLNLFTSSSAVKFFDAASGTNLLDQI